MQFGAAFGLAAATAVSVAATLLGVIVTAFGIRRGGAPVSRPALTAESG